MDLSCYPVKVKSKVVQVETKAIDGRPLCLPSRFVLSIDNRAVLHSLQLGLRFRKSP